MDVLIFCVVISLVIGGAMLLGVFFAFGVLRLMEWLYEKWEV